MATVTVELPEGICSTLGRSPHELEQEVRLAAAIDWYSRGLISQGRGAEIAGVPRADFIDALAARKIEVSQIDFDSLDREFRLRQRLGSPEEALRLLDDLDRRESASNGGAGT